MPKLPRKNAGGCKVRKWTCASEGRPCLMTRPQWFSDRNKLPRATAVVFDNCVCYVTVTGSGPGRNSSKAHRQSKLRQELVRTCVTSEKERVTSLPLSAPTTKNDTGFMHMAACFSFFVFFLSFPFFFFAKSKHLVYPLGY